MRTRLLHVLARLPPGQRLLLVQFFRFGVIGTLGFFWDLSIVYATAPFVGPYWAGVVSYLIASSINWLLNRIWTYRGMSHAAMHRQWVMFLLANSIGFVLNRGAYFALVATVPFCRAHLIVPVAAGGICGMFVNFFVSRRLVFR